MTTQQSAVCAGMDRPNRWYFLLPVLAVILVFVCVNELREDAHLRGASVTFFDSRATPGHAAFTPQDVLAPGSTRQLIASDLTGRIQLIAATAVFLVACGTLVCLCGIAIFRCRRAPLTIRGRLCCGLGVLLIAGVVLWLIRVYEGREVSLLLKSFEDLVIEVMTKTKNHFRDTQQVDLAWTNRLTGALAIFSATLLAVTTAVIIDGVSSARSELADLRRRCASLRTTLAAGAAVLASAVIVVRALQNWTLCYLEQADVLRPIADNWTMALGTYWTLVLIAAYVPAAGIVHRAALTMAENAAPADQRTREQWMEEHDLNVSIKGQVTRVALLLAPWLSGGSLVEIVGAFLK